MEVDNFPTNSSRPTPQPEERKPVEAVVSGATQTRKKTRLQELKHSFIHNDMKRLKEYAVDDILIPSIKRGIDDIVSNGIHMLLYGEAKKPSSSSGFLSTPLRTAQVSYRKFSEDPRTSTTYQEPRRNRGFEYEDILFDTRGDAELLLRKMNEIIGNYGVVDLLTMFDLAGVHAPYTYGDYGWKDISRASIYSERVGGEMKYVIDLPPVLPLR